MAIVKGDRIADSRKLNEPVGGGPPISGEAFWAYAYFVSRLRDDFGRFRYSARLALSVLAPKRVEMTEGEVARMLEEYRRAGLVVTWEEDGATFAEWSGAVRSGNRFHGTPEPPGSNHVHSKSCLRTAVRQARLWHREDAESLSRQLRGLPSLDAELDQGLEQGLDQVLNDDLDQGLDQQPSSSSSSSSASTDTEAHPPAARARRTPGQALGRGLGELMHVLAPDRHGPPGEAESLRREIQALLVDEAIRTRRGTDQVLAKASRTPAGAAIVNLEGCASVPWLTTTRDVLVEWKLLAEAAAPNPEPKADPSAPAAERVWFAALGKLKPGMDPHRYSTWLASLEPVRVDDGVLVLRAANEGHATWVRKNHGADIEAVIGGRHLEILP